MRPFAPLPVTVTRLGAGAALLILLTGCTQFPDIDAATSSEARQAPYPALVDVTPLLTGAPVSATPASALEGRAAALRARAARLRTGDAAEATSSSQTAPNDT